MTEQSWHSCKYARGNLHPDVARPLETLPMYKLLRAAFPEQEWEKSLKKEGINEFYFCRNPSMLRLANKGLYDFDGLMVKGKWKNHVILYRLDLSGYFGENFEAERIDTDSLVKHGLRMCANCRYYKEAPKK